MLPPSTRCSLGKQRQVLGMHRKIMGESAFDWALQLPARVSVNSYSWSLNCMQRGGKHDARDAACAARPPLGGRRWMLVGRFSEQPGCRSLVDRIAGLRAFRGAQEGAPLWPALRARPHAHRSWPSSTCHSRYASRMHRAGRRATCSRTHCTLGLKPAARPCVQHELARCSQQR